MPNQSISALKLLAFTACCLLPACSDHGANQVGIQAVDSESQVSEPGINSALAAIHQPPPTPRTNPATNIVPDQSDQPISAHAKETMSPAQRLLQLLVTGFNGDDDYNSWQCTSENIRSEKTQLSLRFWSDFTGAVSSHRMSWNISNDNAIKISVPQKGVIHLSEIEFESTAYNYDFFSAVDNLGELSNCQWKGMVRYISPEIINMDSPATANIVHNN